MEGGGACQGGGLQKSRAIRCGGMGKILHVIMIRGKSRDHLERVCP